MRLRSSAILSGGRGLSWTSATGTGGGGGGATCTGAGGGAGGVGCGAGGAGAGAGPLGDVALGPEEIPLAILKLVFRAAPVGDGLYDGFCEFWPEGAADPAPTCELRSEPPPEPAEAALLPTVPPREAPGRM